MSNLIRMGIKVALAVFSSYTNDDIDRIDKVSPTQVTNQRLRDFNENLATKLYFLSLFDKKLFNCIL